MEKRVQKVKEPEQAVSLMGFNEFVAFVQAGLTPPEGKVLVPMYSLSYPFYTVWMLDLKLVEHLKKVR